MTELTDIKEQIATKKKFLKCSKSKLRLVTQTHLKSSKSLELLQIKI